MSTQPITLTPPEIVTAVLRAKTPADIERLLSQMSQIGLTGSRAIGDGDNNAGQIELASTPYSPLGERVINGFDAVLELLAQRKGYRTIDDWPQAPSGPREAARELLGLPKAGIGDLTDTERRNLAKNVVVMLDDSGEPQRPTITIEDSGIGATATELPNGLLSLNRSNKLHKTWQHGAYGQGGSATLRFCPYTVYLSRKAPDLLTDGEPDLVSWTIAYKDEGDPYRDALPVYRYWVDGVNQVPVFEPSLLPDPEWHGTRIVHVSYELTRYAQAYTQLTNGAWGMFQALLFDPVMPFLIGGRRQVDLDAVKKGAVADDDMSDVVVAAGDSTRVVLGNKLRLEIGPRGNDPEIPWRGSDLRDLSKIHGRDLGRLRINFWVVRRPVGSTRKTDPVLSYVTADSAVTVTLNGQRHEQERRAWLKDRVALPYLAKSLIVQIDIDELSPPARRQLFSATRERMVEGEMQTLIYDEAVAALKADEELRRFEREMRERAMSKGASQIADKVRTKLQKFITTFIKDKTRKVTVADRGPRNGNGPGTGPPRPPSPPRSTDDHNLPNVPTDMKFERDPIRIKQGQRTTVWVHLDAKNGYLQRHEDDLRVSFSSELGGKVMDIGKSELLAGKSLWTLQAQPDAPLGEGEIEAVLITPNGLLTAAAKVIVIPPPKETKRKQREEEVPVVGPNIEWVTRDQWDDEFNEQTVGQVNISDENTDIRVNRHHPLVAKALDDKTLSEGEVKSRENRYLFAIACGLFRQEYAAREGNRPNDSEFHAEQERMAEAVLIAIDDRTVDFDE